MTREDVIALIQKMLELDQREQAASTYLMANETYPEWGLKAAFEAMKSENEMDKSQTKSHQPKGSMCTSCTKIKADCSSLPFDRMPVIVKSPSGVTVVKCTEFVRSGLVGKLP